MLFTLFSRQSASKNRDYLISYLKDFGYVNVLLEEIQHIHEHGDCFYFKASTASGPLFIKITPRIDQEINNLHFLKEKKLSFVPSTLFGTSIEKEILIEPAIAEPHYMVKQVERYIAKAITLDEFLADEFAVLEKIKEVYSLENSKEYKYPNYPQFLKHTLDKLNDLDWIDFPIVLDGQTFPSLRQMVEIVLEEPILPAKGCLIHGEFSHTNVGKSGDALIIYDWEKMRTEGDPCWDIAKWLKFFYDFYYVVKFRADPKMVPEGLMRVRDQKVEVERAFPKFPELKFIVQEMLNFCGLNRKRIYLGLFLSNLYSLRKTELKFKQTMPLMIASLCSSFVAIE